MSVRHRYRDRRKITRSASKDRRTLVPVARRHSLPSSLAGGIQETRFPVATRTVALMPRFAGAATPRTGTRPAVQSSTSLLYEQATRSTDLTKRVSAERKRETRFRARPRRRRVSGAAVQKRFHRTARPPTKGTHVARREPGYASYPRGSLHHGARRPKPASTILMQPEDTIASKNSARGHGKMVLRSSGAIKRNRPTICAQVFPLVFHTVMHVLWKTRAPQPEPARALDAHSMCAASRFRQKASHGMRTSKPTLHRRPKQGAITRYLVFPGIGSHRRVRR
jgi:hemin uptake protein HemP